MRGHIRWRPSGKAAQLIVYAGLDPITRKPRYETEEFRGTSKRKAETKLAELVTKVEQEQTVTTTGTVAYLFDRWLAIIKRDRSPKTYQGYRQVYERSIRKPLGAIPLAKLTAQHLDDLYNAELARPNERNGKPRSPNTVARVHANLHTALAYAVKQRWVPYNVADLATPPSQVKHEVIPPPIELALKVLVAADACDPDLGMMLRLSAASGIRAGELCGLRWCDVDVTRRTIAIRKSVAVVKDEDADRTVRKRAPRLVIVKDTKSGQDRGLRIGQTTVDLLVMHAERTAILAREHSPHGLVAEAFVFSRQPDGSEPYQPEWVGKAFSKLWKQMGVTEAATLHGLRHLHATQMFAAGVPVTTVSKRLGHAKVSTTEDIYLHALPGDDEAAAELMDQLLTLPAGEPLDVHEVEDQDDEATG